ncbi:FBP domain-containing protein [Microbacterium sp. MEC084]|uniref:FBP domain-containing protein n=1 Tax=Microbacterium sp. MEC084 TaxID=1963027 RepID=UPI0010703F0E|nr:FBP domain-containing protein [Microbacterium sp. MEC084]MCD1268392.1 FBP domain-containing protein [Microbacterium sp. MEC084]
MRPLTESELRGSFVNADPADVALMTLPHDFVLTEWDHLDFLAWRDPRSRGRGYIVAEVDGAPTGVLLRAAEGSSRARSAFCNICRTMQPGNQVSLFTARKAGTAGAHGDSVGTYMCADLSCHENVRLAMPLAPNEYRGSVDMKIDGTKRRTREFVARVLETAA